MEKKDVLDYYWKYFDLHSRQRMQMINFYITVEVALIGGFFVLLNQKNRITWAEYCVLFAVGFLSVIFWLIDRRTRDLIHGCEHCMKKFEEEQMAQYGDELKLMTASEKILEEKEIPITYSTCFHIQFLVMGLFAVGVMYALFKGYI